MNFGFLIVVALVVVVAAIVLPLILKQIGGNKPAVAANLPYRKKDYLLTAAERSFYEVLGSVLDGQLLVFTKVRLADLVYMPKGTANRQTHFNRALMVVGGLGKLGFFALAVTYAVVGVVPMRMALNATPDLILAGIFLWWARTR